MNSNEFPGSTVYIARIPPTGLESEEELETLCPSTVRSYGKPSDLGGLNSHSSSSVSRHLPRGRRALVAATPMSCCQATYKRFVNFGWRSAGRH